MRLEALRATFAPPCRYPVSSCCVHRSLPSSAPPPRISMPTRSAFVNLNELRRFYTGTLRFASFSRSASGLSPGPWLDPCLHLLCDINRLVFCLLLRPPFLSSVSWSVPARWSGGDRIAISSSCTASWLSRAALGFDLRRGNAFGSRFVSAATARGSF
jgi:hypothetical protein